MDLPKILLTGLVCFFLVFLEFLDSWAWDSKNLEKNQINQKKQSWMDLPKIILTGLFFLFFLFFLVFLEFLDSWAWDSKNLEKNDENQKTKKTILNGLTQDSSHRIVFLFFLFFLVFLEFLDSWGLGHQKTSRKTMKTKKQKKQSGIDLLQILLTGLFFLFLFGFPWLFGHMERWKWKKEKNMKKQKMQKPNAPSVPFCFFWGIMFEAHHQF